MKLIEEGDLITEIATPIADKDDRELQVEDYQIRTINLGKHTRNDQINLIDIVATTTKSRLIKDKKAKDELKAQMGKMKDFLKELISSTLE